MWPEGAEVELYREHCVPKVLKLSSEVNECKPLDVGAAAGAAEAADQGAELTAGHVD